jgi:hypothetical protein
LLFSNTLRYRTSSPDDVNISREKLRFSGGRDHAFWFVMLVSIASALSTYSDWPVKRGILWRNVSLVQTQSSPRETHFHTI